MPPKGLKKKATTHAQKGATSTIVPVTALAVLPVDPSPSPLSQPKEDERCRSAHGKAKVQDVECK